MYLWGLIMTKAKPRFTLPADGIALNTETLAKIVPVRRYEHGDPSLIYSPNLPATVAMATPEIQRVAANDTNHEVDFTKDIFLGPRYRLGWKNADALKSTWADYASRLTDDVKHKNP